MAEISVIVPVYRVEDYLDRCIESVLHQTCEDLELILIDDGSPDGCPAICDRYAEEDKRVHVMHQANAGLSAARNAALDYLDRHSESSYLTFLDSDDWLHRDCLRRMLETAKDKNAEMVYCDFENVTETVEDPDLGPLTPLVMDPETAYADHYILTISACCVLLKRELHEGIRFPVGKLHEDAFITHLSLFRAKTVCVIPEKLYYYYANPNSIMRCDWTPRRLQELEAHEVRRDYLKAHGLLKALNQEKIVTVGVIFDQIERIQSMGDRGLLPAQKDLRKKLRRELQENRALVPVNAETFWIYLMAWPGKPLYLILKKAQAWWHRRREG